MANLDFISVTESCHRKVYQTDHPPIGLNQMIGI